MPSNFLESNWINVTFDGLTPFEMAMGATSEPIKAIFADEKNVVNPSLTRKSGFLQSSIDITVVPQRSEQTANVGHVYGKLGQGPKTMPSMIG